MTRYVISLLRSNRIACGTYPGHDAARSTPTSPLPLWERVARIEDARRVRGTAPVFVATPHPARTSSVPPSPTRGEGKRLPSLRAKLTMKLQPIDDLVDHLALGAHR